MQVWLRTKGTLTGGLEVSGTYFYNRQLIYVIMSFIVVFFIAFMNIKILQKAKTQKWIMIIIFVLLFLTLIVGKNINGSKSWINLGFMNLQASELLKIAFILYISYVISRKLPQVREKIKVIAAPLVLIVVCLF